ncbi:DUF6868 family protein [Litorivivens sp.]|uniref:DUF6868 family protein n=1 Tax=Litorivivens sp. TaxID=2020868 RepID=UPI003565EFA9
MIDLSSLTEFVGWSLVINFFILLLVTAVVCTARPVILPLHQKLLGIPEDELLRLYANYLSQYKIAVFVLNFTPYCALKIMVG